MRCMSEISGRRKEEIDDEDDENVEKEREN